MNIIESIPQQGGDDIPTLPNDDKKRKKKLPLTKHEALTLFWQKGIYVDEATGELRTSTNHKVCDKWDLYGYNRHFTFVSIVSCMYELICLSVIDNFIYIICYIVRIYHNRHVTRSMNWDVWTRQNSRG